MPVTSLKFLKTFQIATRSAPSGPHSADVDVSVALGSGQWPGVLARLLFAQAFVPACSPVLLRESAIRHFADLAGESLIVHSRRVDLWDRWAQAVGLGSLLPRRQIRFDTLSAVVDAAERGVGFARVATLLTQTRFASGTLTRVFEQEIGTGESYYAVARVADARQSALRALLDWLVLEFRPMNPGLDRDEPNLGSQEI